MAPAELEGILLSHPSVKDAAVVGVPDAVVGDLPLAHIVLKDGTTTTKQQLYDYVKGRQPCLLRTTRVNGIHEAGG